MSHIRHTLIASLAAATVLTLMSACSDFLDITPTGKVIAKTGEEYRELLTYEYDNFPTDRGLSTLRGDELTLSPTITSSYDYDSYFDIWRWNDIAPSTTTSSFGWRRYYHAIYIANYIIEHQGEITNASQADINQLVGESYMMRAYCHFLLANLYAEPYTQVDPDTTRGVPLMLKADVNAVPYCSSLKAVYNQVLADINQASQLLNVSQWPTGKNYRFNKISAQALRSRVCLYMGRWKDALDAADSVISSHPDLEDLNTSKTLPNAYNSVESIVALENNMPAAYVGIGSPNTSFISLYQSGDLRRTTFYRRVTSSRYTLLKGGSETYACTFRSAEFYLTAAECAACLGDTATARRRLGALLQRRFNATGYAAQMQRLATMDAAELVQEARDERARELAFEGHRWFDLRRTTEPQLTKTYQQQTFTLQQHDSRYTLRFPSEAVEANPNLAVWPVNNNTQH